MFNKVDWISKGNALYTQGNYAAAIACYDNTLAIDANHKNAWRNKGTALKVQGNYAAAIACYDKALAIDSNYKEVWNNKGIVLHTQGNYAAAIACYDKALAIDANYKGACCNKGAALYDQGNYAAAIACYDNALAIDANFKDAWCNKGLAHYTQGGYAAAIACYDKALAIDANYIYAWSNKGLALFCQQHFKEAHVCFEKALVMDANFSFALQGNALYELSQGNTTQASALLNQVAVLEQKLTLSNKVDLWCERAEMFIALKRLTQARELFNKALGLKGESVSIQQRLKALDTLEAKALVPSLESLALTEKTSALVKPSIATPIAQPAPMKPVAVAPTQAAPIVKLSASFTLPYTALSFAMDSNNQPLVLGEGSFGIVYKGRWQYVDVAIKKLKFQTLTDKALKEFQQETQVMANMMHPNITRFYGACMEPQHYCMVMEYLPKGSLSKQLPHLTWSVRWKIALDIGKGLLHLHSKDILHRDLKSLNVLLDKHLDAKIGDFGLALLKSETQTKSANQSSQAKGTLPWMAPELFDNEPNTKACDIYSYGMLLWELAAGKVPYASFSNIYAVIAYVCQGKRETIPQHTPPSFAKLIEKCWAQRAHDRPKIEEVVQELEAKQDEATLNFAA